MGEDFHQRIYVKSRKSGHYINAHDICSWDPKYSMFRELIEGRNYEVFSLFGSRRGDYEELGSANYGIPDFLKGSVFEDYCRECGYYGFVWFKLPGLAKAVKEYSDRLKDPFQYLDPDSDEYADWKDLKDSVRKGKVGIEKFMERYRAWLDGHRNVLDRLGEMSEILDEYSEEGGHGEIYGKLVDLNETVFLFFFDN